MAEQFAAPNERKIQKEEGAGASSPKAASKTKREAKEAHKVEHTPESEDRPAAEEAAKVVKKVKKDTKKAARSPQGGPEASEQPAASSGRKVQKEEGASATSPKAATKAKKAHEMEYPPESEDRPAKEEAAEQPPLRIYVGRCPPSLDEATLRATFAPCGAVSTVQMIVEKKQFKGTCFVTFASPGSVPAALRLDGTELDGSRLLVKIAAPKPAKVPRSQRPAALAVAALHASIAEKSGRGKKRKAEEGGEEGETPKGKLHKRGNKRGNRAGHSARPAKVRKRSEAAIEKAAAAGKVLY